MAELVALEARGIKPLMKEGRAWAGAGAARVQQKIKAIAMGSDRHTDDL